MQTTPGALLFYLLADQDEGPLVEIHPYRAPGSHPSGYLRWER